MRDVKAVKHVALHQLRAGIRQEALIFGGIPAIKHVGHDGIQDGIAKILQPLIVEQHPVSIANMRRAVQARQLVKLQIPRAQSRNGTDKRIKLLFLWRKELYMV